MNKKEGNAVTPEQLQLVRHWGWGPSQTPLFLSPAPGKVGRAVTASVTSTPARQRPQRTVAPRGTPTHEGVRVRRPDWFQMLWSSSR